MNEDTRTRPSGRIFHAFVYGNTADEMELRALDDARAVFGTDTRLEIIRDYSIIKASTPPNGERFATNIKVRTVEP